MAVPPDWLATLANELALRIHPVDPLAPLGCHFAYHAGCWEVTLFVSTTEIIGGQCDGEAFASAFHFDLVGIESLFDSVTRLGWQPIELGDGDDLGPHIAVEGVYQRRRVWVRVTACPPAGYESGRVFNLLDSTITEKW
jgi:hypothetical protein